MIKKRLTAILLILTLMTVFFSACTNRGGKDDEIDFTVIDDNYRNYYEIFVASYQDSDGDGKGDLNGVTQKLDYIADMGFTGIWLMPINPSPSYHKYDVTDYFGVDALYGTVEDFENLAAECKKRDIKLIIDLVLNHTSYNHPWFASARKSIAIAPCGKEVCSYANLCREHNKYTGYYNFVSGSKPSGKFYNIGMSEGWYYEGEFWDQMPDLNMDSAELKDDIKEIVDFWLGKGADGFRLDAVMHIYNEDHQKNIVFWKWFSDYCRTVKEDAYLVGEVWSSAAVIEDYYASGLDSIFNFPFSALNYGSIYGAVTYRYGGGGYSAESFGRKVQNWYETIKSVNPAAIDAPFLTNHDNDRSAGAFMKNPERIKMAAALYLFMPGNSFTYYGEEIGMLGSGIDENKRAPMYWSDNSALMTDPPAGMQSDKTQPVFDSWAQQKNDPDSILNFYRKAVRLRNHIPAIPRGKPELIAAGDTELCVYSLTYGESKVIIIHNISDEVKTFDFSKAEHGYEGIENYLGAKPSLKGNQLTMQPMTTLILQ